MLNSGINNNKDYPYRGVDGLCCKEKVMVPKMLSSSVDWRKERAVTPTKNQYSCAIGVVEGIHQIVRGSLIDLPVQQLLDCDKANGGCITGIETHAYEYIMLNGGINSGKDYSYRGIDGLCCKEKAMIPMIVLITGYSRTFGETLGDWVVTCIYKRNTGKTEDVCGINMYASYQVNSFLNEAKLGGLFTGTSLVLKTLILIKHRNIQMDFRLLLPEAFFFACSITVLILRNRDSCILINFCSVSQVPSSVDWRKEGTVTPVKNQYSCESCWAFAVVAVERIHQIVRGSLIDLPVQQLVDYDRANGGCITGIETHGTDYWILKNSWGKACGLGGYIYLQKNTDKAEDVCGINMYVSYQVIVNSLLNEAKVLCLFTGTSLVLKVLILMKHRNLQMDLRLLLPEAFFFACSITVLVMVPKMLPSSVDWRKEVSVTPIKNQYSCAVGPVKEIHQIVRGSLIDLPVQPLVDCDRANGGYITGIETRAYEYIILNGGINSDKDYPYRGVDGLCCKEKETRRVASVDGYVKIPPEMRNCYYRREPRQCSWIFNDFSHFVLIIVYGFKDGTDYWILKNSWGKGWGLGYMYLQRNTGKADDVWDQYVRVLSGILLGFGIS
ncbi:hypothetical protein BUALT_Bualt17G0053700 [Buddleja alternifolia]|uniref:Peptidase C1A papain C-terminal domain-containing protein n=1 Tax=Buddleja alternifolia TaxID=168488 RepID=A0AAV6WH31_9LAMI|nr:hypothetical protein BUALT_Bualt17G0053700 [Buddleja alternifolia]